jgi:hypothetical protein
MCTQSRNGGKESSSAVIINGPKIITALICKIPPASLFQREEQSPSLAKRGKGRFSEKKVCSIIRPFDKMKKILTRNK